MLKPAHPFPTRPFPASAAPVSAVLLGIALASGPVAVADQDHTGAALEEVIVTATFRDDQVSRVPSSVTVITADTIAARDATHLDDLLGALPNLNFAKGASRARFLQLRGIGERGQFEEPLNASVGLIVDGVDLSGIGTVAGLFDVAQVEVLRGPQGTLYGANALAGLINVVTKAPTTTRTGRIELGTGSYGAYRAGGVISGPLSDRLRGRLVARIDASDGYIKNDYLSRKDTDGTRDLSLRGRLSLDVAEDVAVNLAAGYLDADNGYDAFALDNSRTTLTDQPGEDRQRTSYGSASVHWNGVDAFATRFHLGLAVSDIKYGYDGDWVYSSYPGVWSATDEYLRDRDTITAEIRLVSKQAGRIFNGSTAWTAGAYLFQQDVDLLRRSEWISQDFTSGFGIDRIAVFGQTETDLGAATRLILGLRLEHHSSSYYDSNGVGFEPSDDLHGGRLALHHQLSEDASVYGSISRGYKAGGFNADDTLPETLRVYDPETLWNYEAGLQARMGQLGIRLAVFHMRRVDVQIESSRVRPVNQFIQYVGNAAEGTNQGVELDLDWLVGKDLLLFARAGLLNTEYQDYISSNGEDFDGRDQAHAPHYQFNAGAEFAFGRNDAYFARLEVEARDDFYFSDNHNLRSEAYRLVHASAGYQGRDWLLRVWGRNLADEDYFVRGFFFNNEPPYDGMPRGYTQLGAPRLAGITVSKSW